jgi:IS5 family transposase
MRRVYRIRESSSPGQGAHPFLVIKRQFCYTKVRFRGLVKNTPQQTTLLSLSGLWMMRKAVECRRGVPVTRTMSPEKALLRKKQRIERRKGLIFD